MADGALETVKQETREEQCPECFAQCWFCSDYVWMVRSLGCGARNAPGRRDKNRDKPCPNSIPEKGKACGTCGKPADKQCQNGGGMVKVERRITGANIS